MVLKFGKNFIFISEIANFWNPFAATTPAKKDWKMIIEFYTIMTRLYYKVKVRIEMSLFLGENKYFYKK